MPMAADAKNIIQKELTANHNASNPDALANPGSFNAITVLYGKIKTYIDECQRVL